MALTKKEKLDLILSKLPEDKKEQYISELRTTKTKEERSDLLAKYGIQISDDERKELAAPHKALLSDDELDAIAGGDGVKPMYCTIGHCGTCQCSI